MKQDSGIVFEGQTQNRNETRQILLANKMTLSAKTGEHMPNK